MYAPACTHKQKYIINGTNNKIQNILNLEQTFDKNDKEQLA